MKKTIFIIILLSLLFVLPSCTIKDGEVKERIISPENNLPPIHGKWRIDELIKTQYGTIKDESEDIYVGKEALFHKEGVILGEAFTNKPSYKIKSVKTRDYLLYKYKTSPINFGITDERIKVITILDDNKFFNEFIKINESTMFVSIDDNFYKMVKIIDEVSVDEINRYISVEKTMMRSLGVAEEANLQTGVLLGLSIPNFDEDAQAPKWDYKTIWLRSQNREIVDIYELDGLLVPRKNGFWKIDSIRELKDDSVNDELLAIPQFKLSEKQSIFSDMDLILPIKNEYIRTQLPSIIKNVLFVGNDYISVENIDLDRNSRKTLQIYAIDNLEEKKPIKLTDLIGTDGQDLFYEGARSVLNLDSSIIPNEENVGLIRRNGYWIMKGRINYKQNDEELYKDFNIKTIPPKDMVSYDELSIPWDAIRIMVPDVVDVFSSPNNDFIIVISSSHLVVYPIQEGDLINKPIAQVKLPFDSKIIMSEWGLGRYPNIWQSEVIKNNGVKVEY